MDGPVKGFKKMYICMLSKIMGRSSASSVLDLSQNNSTWRK